MFGSRYRARARRAFVEHEVTAALAEQRRCFGLAVAAMTSQAYRDQDDPDAVREMCTMMTRARTARCRVDEYLAEWAALPVDEP